jgi:large repetitive protein
VGGSGKVVQGATLQYTINFQVSDYFAFNQLNLADLLPDGVRFDTTFTPTLTVTQHTGNSATAGFQTSNVSVGSINSDGSQTVNFTVSGELISRADPAGGNLVGGDIPLGGTGGAQPGNTNPSLFAPGTTGQIVFRGVIQTAYTVKASPLGDKTIKQGDTLTNLIPDRTNAFSPNTGGRVLNYSDLSGTGTFQADTTSATVTAAVGSLAKSIYAIDGSTAVISPYQVQTGDTITYRLTYTMPTGSVEKLTLTDFLPLPIFDATNGGSTTAFTFNNISSATAPAAYHAQFGPSDQYLTRFETGLGYAAPTISTPTDGTNRAIITFPQDLQDPQQRTTTVDILFTVPILDKPFTDGLFLTNQANSQEGNTSANVSTANTIAQIQLEDPNLSVVKSVVASTLVLQS